MAERPIRDFFPILVWLPNYRRQDLAGDLNAGLVTAIMLVPQSMAYALLAGLPPEMGLYSSILPLLLYTIFGTSRTLAVGPVALVSLMVASTLGHLTQIHPEKLAQAPALLALMVGGISVTLGLLRVGFVVNFISHHVISGFTSAAALLIALSQLKHLLGIDIPRGINVIEMPATVARQVGRIDPAAPILGVLAIAVLLFFAFRLPTLLRRAGISGTAATALGRSGPLVVVILATLAVTEIGLDVGVVGKLPTGLPPLTVPSLDFALIEFLAGPALLISFVGFLESVSVAKALASRRRQRIGANQELVGLGVANVGAAFTGGYPVTGGFSRSSVNFSAGANTPLSSIVTAVVVAATAAFLTPLFHDLPKAVLAAIIMVAVLGLVDIRTLRGSWRYSKADTLALVGTFVSVFAFGVEIGILIGVGLSVLLHLWRASRPHVAVVGRVPGTEHFRNVKRHKVEVSDRVSAIRIDESLFFANAAWFETWVLNHVADNPEMRHLVLICAAINYIDGSALEAIERLEEELCNAGVTLHLAEVKGPVMDKLEAAGFADYLGPARIHISTHAAMSAVENSAGLGCFQSSRASSSSTAS